MVCKKKTNVINKTADVFNEVEWLRKWTFKQVLPILCDKYCEGRSLGNYENIKQRNLTWSKAEEVFCEEEMCKPTK